MSGWSQPPATTSEQRLASTPLSARGGLSLRPGAGVFLGRSMQTDLHDHHALQLVIARAGQSAVRTSTGEAWQEAGAVLVPPHVPHELREGDDVLLLYLEPEAAVGAALLEAWPAHDGQAGFVRLPDMPPGLAASLCGPSRTLQDARWSDVWRAADDFVASLLASRNAAVTKLDPRVREILADFRSDDGELLTLTQAARRAGLSASRFAHLFAEGTGMPMRRYRLWLRLQDALVHALRSGSLTEAAHQAGFSDAAHLTRTFRSMFGIAPSSILRP